MGERPLIVVLLSVPVKCLVAAKQATGKVLGDLVVGGSLALFALLKALEMRTSIPVMLLSGLMRGVVVGVSLFIAIQGAKMLLSYVISDKLSLYVSIPTTFTLFLTLFNITWKRVAAKEIPNFAPLLFLTFLDLFSLFLALVSPYSVTFYFDFRLLSILQDEKMRFELQFWYLQRN